MQWIEDVLNLQDSPPFAKLIKKIYILANYRGILLTGLFYIDWHLVHNDNFPKLTSAQFELFYDISSIAALIDLNGDTDCTIEELSSAIGKNISRCLKALIQKNLVEIKNNTVVCYAPMWKKKPVECTYKRPTSNPLIQELS